MIQNVLQTFAAACNNHPSFFGFPTWYKYLDVKEVAGKCEVQFSLYSQATGFNGDDTLRVALAIIDILVRVAALVALAFVIYGGIKYTTSQGSPEGTKSAKDTLFNALIGLVIAIIAASVVAFIGNQLIS